MLKNKTVLMGILFSLNTVHAAMPIAMDPDLPLPKVVGAPTIKIFQQAPALGRVEVVATGQVIQNGNPLAVALKLATRGDVIGCQGEFEGVTIGKINPSKTDAVWWPGNAAIEDVAIKAIDANQPCTLRGISIMGDYQTPNMGGVNELLFQHVIFKNMGSSSTAFIVFVKSMQGMIRLYDTAFESGSPGSYSGYGLKWNIRSNGRARWDIRGMKLIAAQEHGLYLDSPGADGGGDSYFLDIIQTAPTGRTGIQIVNRKDPLMGGGPTGLGNLFFRRLDIWTMAGGGGSGLTVAGHLGHVFVDHMKYKGDLGAVVFWSDIGKGLHLTPEGYSCPGALIKNLSVDSPATGRSHVMVSGVGVFEIRRFFIKGNKTALDFDTQATGPKNGSVYINVPGLASQYLGFQSTIKVQMDGIKLNSTQIDALGN